ncbi:Fibroblast growth factor receptor 3 [Folsomia candida]|uniref:Fibroblast growth factor receptor 3 n=1 Tax=Folsomia candida TaxID=158441 RepID=A0A226DX55_FOLCA|nr:Fibroblast growth factor receptor 3 [Folsomia candida]
MKKSFDDNKTYRRGSLRSSADLNSIQMHCGVLFGGFFTPFVFVGCLFILFAGVAIFLLPKKDNHNASDPGTMKNCGDKEEIYISLWKHPTVLANFIAIFLTSSVITFYFALIEPFLRIEFATSPSVIGFVFTGAGLLYSAFSVIASLLTVAVGSSGYLFQVAILTGLTAQLVGNCAIVGIGIDSNFVTVVTGICFLSFGCGLTIFLFFLQAQDILKKICCNTERASSISAGAYMSSLTLGSMAGSMLESRQQDPGQIAEAGLQNFVIEIISNFPEWINENGMDPTPPLDRTFPISYVSGPITLTGYFYNVSVIGLSSITSHRFVSTSYETLRIGMYIYLRHGGIQGSYNVTGEAVGTFPVVATSTFKLASSNVGIGLFLNMVQKNGIITLTNGSYDSSYLDFNLEKTSLAAQFDNLFDLAPTISPENKKYVADHLAKALPDKVFRSREKRICQHFVVQVRALSGQTIARSLDGTKYYSYTCIFVSSKETPITDIIAWPEKGPSTTIAPITTTTTRPASSTALTTSKPPSTTTTPTTTAPTTTTPTTTTPTTTTSTTTTSTTTTPTTTTPTTTTSTTTTPTTTASTITTSTTTTPTTTTPTTTTPTTITPTITTSTTTTPTITTLTITAQTATTTTTTKPTTTAPTTTELPTTIIYPVPTIPPNETYTACQLAAEIAYISGRSIDWDTQLENWLCLSKDVYRFCGKTITSITFERVIQFAPNLAHTISKVTTTPAQSFKFPSSKMAPKSYPKKTPVTSFIRPTYATKCIPLKTMNSATLKNIDRHDVNQNPATKRQVTMQSQVSPGHVNRAMTDRGVRTLIPVGSNAKINLKYFMDSVLHKLLEVKIAKKQFGEPDKNNAFSMEEIKNVCCLETPFTDSSTLRSLFELIFEDRNLKLGTCVIVILGIAYLLNNLEGSITCAKYIFEENGFHEWPEYRKWCSYIQDDYLVECRRPPGFITTYGPETAKVFNELSQNQRIACSVHGVPPPEVTWDAETTAYVARNVERLETSQFRERATDGSWMVQRRLTFTKVVLSDDRGYTCLANNIASNKTQEYTVTVVPTPDNSSWIRPTFLSTGIALALLTPAVLLLLCRRKRSIKLEKIYDAFKHGGNSDDQSNNKKPQLRLSFLPSEIYRIYQNLNALPFPKELQIIPSRLTLNRKHVLGRGEFGTVYMGLLDGITPTAIKTVTDDSDDAKLNALLSEVKVIAYVGSHKNVTQLLGVQLVDLRTGLIYVVVEYCSLGSLKEYELLRWCHQISNAMEFLGSKKIIHGDLATRNVLLDHNCVAKVTDFGLSRQMFNNYKQSVIGSWDISLPVAWLSIEALRHLRFSIQSDVWVFGVFMWEVFAMGETPYIGINLGPDFIQYLEDGHRLEMPEHATEEM